MNTWYRRLPEKLQQGLQSAYALGVVFLVFYPVILTLGVEYVQKGGVLRIWEWISQNPYPFLLNYAILLLLHLILFGLIGSFYFSAAASALLFSLLSVVSYYKRKALGEPLFPWDLLLNKEGMDIAPLVAERSALIYFVGIALIIAFFVTLRFLLPRVRVKWYVRLVCILMPAAVLWTTFYVQPEPVQKMFGKMGVSNTVWQQVENYKRNGMFLAFALNVKSAIIHAPDHYSQNAIATLAGEAGSKAPNGTAPSGKKPNVIIVMNEAFWDPTVLENVTFSKDPAPTLHELQKTATSGWLLSPQYGGGTANVEFEVLTGHSIRFLPPGSIAYQQYVHRPMESLASTLKKQGYRTLAIHSYEGWFWNRDRVYPLLGFEEFISKEKFVNPKYKGPFISDEEVSRKIIEQTEASDEPVFIYAVTMQNHGPYDGHRYTDNTVKATGHLSPGAKEILETYAQGVADADAGLRMLVDYYSHSDEPTVIVFFGDHLPILGYDFAVFHETGFVSSANSAQWTLDELRRMHSVPFVLWSNMQWKKETIPLLGTSFLGSYLLDRLQMPMPAYHRYLRDFSEKIPALIKGLAVEANGKMHQDIPAEYKTLEHNYWLLQYDQMFGKQYLYQLSSQKVSK